MKIRMTAGCAAVAVALVTAGPANADADSYLAYLSQLGVNPFATVTAGGLVTGGLNMCNLLRSGMSPQDAANSMGMLSGVLGVPVVEAAQHELCPDTLH